MNIFQILNNNASNMSEEEQEYAYEFTNVLREKIINELVQYEGEVLISSLSEDREIFFDKVDQIFSNGVKGYNKMTIQLLVNIFLEKKGEESFFRLIEGISIM